MFERPRERLAEARPRAPEIVFHVAIAVAAALWMAASDARAQAVLTPNQVGGVIELTNQNPEILEIFDPAATNQGFTDALIRADSVDVSPQLNNWAYPRADGGHAMEYQVTVETSDEGIAYQVVVDVRLDRGGEQYLFAPATSAPVTPEPAADTELHFSECAGVVDVTWVNGLGETVAVVGGYIHARRPTANVSAPWTLQAQDFYIANGSTHERLAVRGDGAEYKVSVTYESGTDPYANKVRHLCEEYVSVSCDEVVEIVCEIPSGGELGAIGGNVDMVGEEEHHLGTMTRIRASGGPFRNERYATVDATPSEGRFDLPNLMPSAATSPARGYAVSAELIFGIGNRMQYFRTPFRTSYNGGAVMVEAGQTTDMGNTFVMNPGWVEGDVLLAGPPRGETTVTCTATDACGNESQCSFLVSVEAQELPPAPVDDTPEPEGEPEIPEDTTEPDACADDVEAPIVECSVTAPLLWPPNHDLVSVGFASTAEDACVADPGNPVSGLDHVTRVWSDEPENPRRGDGSGWHAPDAREDDDTLLLRRERRGRGDGRIYLLLSKAEDPAGNTGHACCTVAVPHDRSKRSIRSAQLQAAMARAYCEDTGTAPPGWYLDGFSRDVGPKQAAKGLQGPVTSIRSATAGEFQQQNAVKPAHPSIFWSETSKGPKRAL